MTIIIADLARNISSSHHLPFNCLTYSQVLVNEFQKFQLKYKTKLDTLNVSLNALESAINNFSIAVTRFNQRKNLISESESV